MIRKMNVLFCDNEHGFGDVTFPDLNQSDITLQQHCIAPSNAGQLRREAKKEGWGHVQGVDYCPACMGNDG